MGSKIRSNWGISQNLFAISSGEHQTLDTHHKEECEGRIKVDMADRLSLRKTLSLCIDLLNNESHPDGASINIADKAVILDIELCKPLRKAGLIHSMIPLEN